jgi:hypothetical protein
MEYLTIFHFLTASHSSNHKDATSVSQKWNSAEKPVNGCNGKVKAKCLYKYSAI